MVGSVSVIGAGRVGTAVAARLEKRGVALGADADRPLYHAAAPFASGYLVTLYRTAASLFEEVGAPPEALLPLMRRTIDNGFELTGPISRGDWRTVEAHVEALRGRRPELGRPELENVYRALAEATAP